MADAALAPRLPHTYTQKKGWVPWGSKKHEHQKPTGKKNTISTAGRERRRQGRKEGGKEGRTAGRKQQRPSSKMLRAPSNLHMVLSRSCKPHAIYKCWFQSVAKTAQFTVQILAATRCKHHATICNTCALHYADDAFNILQIPCHVQL